MTRVPEPLAALGARFVPIPPRRKGAKRRHSRPEDLYAADDPVFQAYMENGHNYWFVTRGDYAVLDADDLAVLAPALAELPTDTVRWVTGSRGSTAYCFHVPGLSNDIELRHPDHLDDPDANVGHIKGAHNSVAVGPGSIHPSGGKYGPVHGDHIATVSEERLRDALDAFIRDADRPTTTERSGSGATPTTDATEGGGESGSGSAGDYGDPLLPIHDVLSPSDYPRGQNVAHPVHGSTTGRNFRVDDDAETFHCWRCDVTGNGLHLVGMRHGIITCGEWRDRRLDPDTWREIFDAARDDGHDLGEPPASGATDAEYVPILPPAVRDLTGWDWRAAGRRQARAADDNALTIDDARARTQEAIADAYRYGDNALVDALMTTGKSYGAIAAAAETDTPILALTGRGHVEQYEQFQEWCDEHGLTARTLPSFTELCPTYLGEHGDEWERRAKAAYHRGATGRDIHRHAERVFGEPLPCTHGGTCPWQAAWRFDPDDYDVLIGHYLHAHVEKVTAGRTVVVDEFPDDAYETTLAGETLSRAVTRFLRDVDALPYDDYTELIERRHDPEDRADALLWFGDGPPDPDPEQAFDGDHGDASAPLAVYALLVATSENHRGRNLGNGWEFARLGVARRAAFDREDNALHLLTPPALDYASGVVALDGTPTPAMWELAIGRPLNHRQVLTDAERREYIRDTLGHRIIPTTDAIKPYHSAQNVNARQDTALLAEIHGRHGRKPDLITSRKALGVYDDAAANDGDDPLAHVNRSEHRGNTRGSNQFKRSRLGAVVGSQHFGDEFVKKWGAFADEAVETPDRSVPENRGAGLSYDAFGDKILHHMREHAALQEVLRFGRDGRGATVYVHTGALPEWVPTAGEGRVKTTWSDGMRQVLDATRRRREWRTAEIAADPGVDLTQRQVFNHLTRLADEGDLTREYDGRGYVWHDDGLHRVNEYGAVDLEPLDLAALPPAAVAEISRKTLYTWDFLTCTPSRGERNEAGEPPAATEVKPPPDDDDSTRSAAD